MDLKRPLACLCVILICATITIALSAIIVQYLYPNLVTISSPSLELWLDADSTDGIPAVKYPNETAIDWGMLDAGDSYFFDNMTVLNTGNIPLTITITAYGLPEGWTLTWAGDGTLVDPTETVEGVLTLTVPEGATTPTEKWGFWINGE